MFSVVSQSVGKLMAKRFSISRKTKSYNSTLYWLSTPAGIAGYQSSHGPQQRVKCSGTDPGALATYATGGWSLPMAWFVVLPRISLRWLAAYAKFIRWERARAYYSIIGDRIEDIKLLTPPNRASGHGALLPKTRINSKITNI
jgi:hypothetical protein